jgi:transketolase
MRDAFFRSLLRLAAEDERIFLLTADLGFGVAEEFRLRFADRFINVGVAEQNMTGVAAGLALAGKTVFTYSIANFPTLRCLEQLRNDVCYHNANVKVVAVGGGLAYGPLGPSHHATEDLAIVRSLPNVTVVAPGDPLEAEQATAAIARRGGPCYLRLGRAGEPAVHESLRLILGRAVAVRRGADVSLIAAGGMLATAAQVAGQLASDGIEAGVWSMHTLKPLDADAVRDAARSGVVFTLEEHSLIGGLGSAVAEVLSESGYGGVFRRIALPDRFAPCAGSAEYLRRLSGLDADSIRERVRLEIRTRVESRRSNAPAVQVAAVQVAAVPEPIAESAAHR